MLTALDFGVIPKRMIARSRSIWPLVYTKETGSSLAKQFVKRNHWSANAYKVSKVFVLNHVHQFNRRREHNRNRLDNNF